MKLLETSLISAEEAKKIAFEGAIKKVNKWVKQRSKCGIFYFYVGFDEFSKEFLELLENAGYKVSYVDSENRMISW